MAGNTIYMQEGSNYIDIHDNEVVNLSVEKATVSVAEGDASHNKDNVPTAKCGVTAKATASTSTTTKANSSPAATNG